MKIVRIAAFICLIQSFFALGMEQPNVHEELVTESSLVVRMLEISLRSQLFESQGTAFEQFIGIKRDINNLYADLGMFFRFKGCPGQLQSVVQEYSPKNFIALANSLSQSVEYASLAKNITDVQEKNNAWSVIIDKLLTIRETFLSLKAGIASRQSDLEALRFTRFYGKVELKQMCTKLLIAWGNCLLSFADFGIVGTEKILRNLCAE